MTTQRLYSTAMMACLAATVAHAQTAVTLSPAANPSVGHQNVSGAGFCHNEIVDLYFDTADEELAVTNSGGAFSATAIPVPAWAFPGTHRVVGER